MKRRDFFKGISSLSAVIGLSKVIDKLPQKKEETKQVKNTKMNVPVYFSDVPNDIVVDSNFPEFTVNLNTGKLYQEVGNLDFDTKQAIEWKKKKQEEFEQFWHGETS